MPIPAKNPKFLMIRMVAVVSEKKPTAVVKLVMKQAMPMRRMTTINASRFDKP